MSDPAKAEAERRAKNAKRHREWYQSTTDEMRKRCCARGLKWQRDNPEKVRAANKIKYKKNREKILARAKEWQRDNPEKVRAANKIKYKNNREYYLKKRREWNADKANKEKVRLYNREYYLKVTKKRRQEARKKKDE